ncbi:hypothetical protein [Lacticaseibacillus nasuensis]|uniref:Uncharacterized protein n=1 Tax=Lacticaseibacillus nasuensis JCM 17158 TaxID=1291734 RepID=A0A0R1JXE0_9LACO|nr:hypothetical protein [Lacticaseibacillus nasuensis]KRK73923.1 hypothetical protein FD02_GL001754 [Lacticaseibacillus nasuensis JCM 17158]
MVDTGRSPKDLPDQRTLHPNIILPALPNVAGLVNASKNGHVISDVAICLV